jgi:hypothetical protein
MEEGKLVMPNVGGKKYPYTKAGKEAAAKAKAKKDQPKPKMYTQAQVDKMLAAARKQANNPIPSPKKQAAMKKRLAEEAMDKKMKAAAKRKRVN